MQYSENMIVYTGRKAVHIFDIDRERWVFNCTDKGYQYDDIAESVKVKLMIGESSSNEEESEDNQEEELI